MEEIWRDIKGCEGIYQVSNLGRVRSLDHDTEYSTGVGARVVHAKGKVLKTVVHGRSRITSVWLRDGRGRYLVSVPRLVAEAFLDQPIAGLYIGHIDGNPQNNCIDNLVPLKTPPGKRKRVKNTTTGEIYMSVQDTAELFGTTSYFICKAIKNGDLIKGCKLEYAEKAQ